MWLDDDGEDTPRGGVPDPSQRHWRHPAEVAAELAAAETIEPIEEESTARRSIVGPFGALVGSISICSLALIAVVLSGFGDKPMTTDTYQAASGRSADDSERADQAKAEEIDPAGLGDSSELATPHMSAAIPTDSYDSSAQPSADNVDKGKLSSLSKSDKVYGSPEVGIGTDADGSFSEPDPSTEELASQKRQPGTKALSSVAERPLVSNQITSSTINSETAESQDELSGPSVIPILFAKAGAGTTPLGSFVTGHGYILTSTMVLGNAASAAIQIGDSWVVVRPVLEVAGVAVLVPATGQSLDGLSPQVSQDPTPLSVGQRIIAGSPDPTTSRHVGTITKVGDRITTNVRFDPYLSGAPLFNKSGVAIGVVTAEVAATNEGSDGTVVAAAISPDAFNPFNPLAFTRSPFRIIGSDGLEIKMTSSGLVVIQVPDAVTTSLGSLSSLFKVGDIVLGCGNATTYSISGLATIATNFTSGSSIECTVVRDDVEVVIKEPEGQLVGASPQE